MIIMYEGRPLKKIRGEVQLSKADRKHIKSTIHQHWPDVRWCEIILAELGAFETEIALPWKSEADNKVILVIDMENCPVGTSYRVCADCRIFKPLGK